MLEAFLPFFKEEQRQSREILIPELIVFFNPYFPSEQDTKSFVLECEDHPDPIPKRILHQIHRHISLADEMVKLKTSPVKDSLQIFFWIVTIESIFKASTPFTKKQKVEVVREFFSIYLDRKDQEELVKSISKVVKPFQHVNIELVANMFNTVRNMVAHEGIFWMFSFPTKNGDSSLNDIPKEKTSFLSTYTMGEENLDTYMISITKEEVRAMIVRGSLNYLKNVINNYKGEETT